MVKKVLALAFGLVLAVSAIAQWGSHNPTVPQSDIQFWTGTGSNRAVIAITWEDDNEDYIGIAWGVQWNGGSIMLKSLMDTIAAYDSRFTMDFSNNWVNNLSYVDTALGLNLVGEDGWWWYNWLDSNDTDRGSAGVTSDMVQSGDFVDWMQMGTADTMIMAIDPNAPTDPQPEEATIAASDILYWVGTGAKEVVLAVNWADTALAWGYRFDGTKSVADMMNDIAAADPRFSIEVGQYGLDDILFVVAPGDTLRKQAYSWWESTNNGVMDAGMGQELNNGDFEKWADPTAGIIVDSTYWSDYNMWTYTYVYTMEIHPVSVPTTEGISVAEGMTLSVYPNPAVSSVNVSFNALESATEVVLFDMTGRRVAAMPVAAGSSEVQIAVDGLATGVYMLRMGDASAKVVVR